MIVYFTTVVRSAPLEQGGELVKLDWEQKKVLAQVPIIPRDPAITDPNPRGGTRGGRGILLNHHEIFVASYHTLHVFNRDLELTRSLTHPLFAGLHELSWDGEGMWVSSTTLDAAIKVSISGATLASWWPRDDALVARRFELPPLQLDREKDNRLAYLGKSDKLPGHVHLNAAAILDGRPLMLLNHFGALVRLQPTEILVADPRLKGCHNILVTRDRHILINDTVNQAVMVYDAAGTERKRVDLRRFRPVRRIRRRFALWSARLWLGRHVPSHRVSQWLVRDISASRPVFVRGLAETERGTILVGISPATILEIDWRQEKLLDHFAYSENVQVCVHGLACA